LAVLNGINKILHDSLNTIVESMNYLCQTYLKSADGSSPTDDSIKVLTMGHSLGGGLCTLFSLAWYEICRIEPYNKAPFTIFKKPITTISIASPRVLSTGLSEYYCDKVKEKQIILQRITVRGDPVPGLPNKAWISKGKGYDHPCSSEDYVDERKQISLDIASTIRMRPLRKIDYNAPFKAKNIKTRMQMSANPGSHTEYLNIDFNNAVSILEFIGLSGRGADKSSASEIKRSDKGHTMVRLILGEADENTDGVLEKFKTIFYDLEQLRIPDEPRKEGSTDELDQPTKDDIYMSPEIFKQLIDDMHPLEGDQLNPKTPTDVEELDPKVKMPRNITGVITEGAKAAPSPLFIRDEDRVEKEMPPLSRTASTASTASDESDESETGRLFTKVVPERKLSTESASSTESGETLTGGKKRKWSLKYKKSINCDNPKGFSQKQYCKYGRKQKKTKKNKKNHYK
jgi:hypothetical protein